MIKLRKSLNTDNSAKSSSTSWTLIKTSPKGKWASLRLPLTVGFSVDNDIYVNAPTMRAISKVLLNVNGVLTLVDAQSQEVVDFSQLKLFGIEASGPYFEDPSAMSGMRRLVQALLSKERFLYQAKYPRLFSKFLPKKQTARLICMAAMLLLSIQAIEIILSENNAVEDRSSIPIAAEMHSVKQLGIKSSGGTSPYAKGATVVFKDLEKSSTQNYSLSLTVSGLDLAEELTISVNGKAIGHTTANLACVDAPCTREFAVPAETLQAEHNVVKIEHKSPESSYELRNIFFRPLEPASDEEKETVKQLLISAERYYEERQILVQNIRQALDAVSQAELMLQTRTGLEQVESQVKIAKKKVQDAFAEKSKDLQFTLQKELTLNHTKNALKTVSDLMQLYPDPTSKQNIMLATQKKKLQAQESKR